MLHDISNHDLTGKTPGISNVNAQPFDFRYIYLILSSEINAYQKQIKVISITSEMI